MLVVPLSLADLSYLDEDCENLVLWTKIQIGLIVFNYAICLIYGLILCYASDIN